MMVAGRGIPQLLYTVSWVSSTLIMAGLTFDLSPSPLFSPDRKAA